MTPILTINITPNITPGTTFNKMNTIHWGGVLYFFPGLIQSGNGIGLISEGTL
jgi:hypothetical protein